ncbi:MAG: dihydroorotase [Clostridiales bacterium]|nr:dihydroorotase [Clostridiales bacterium]
MRLLIKNGRVVDPSSGTDETLDILIDQGKIADIRPKIEEAEGFKVLDVSRLVVAPGFIDMHAHLREPGQEYKEDIQTASRAAARGGFTSICAMPNTDPVNDNRGVTEFILAEAEKRAAVNIFPIAAITSGLRGEQITDMADLLDAGAVAFSDDGRCVQNSLVMRRALEYSDFLQTLIIDHCEDFDLSQDGLMHEGSHSYFLGLKGIPASAEEVIIARDIILAEAARARIHIAHLSTRGGARLVEEAKKRKVKVTAEVTPHHLVLSDDALANYDTNLKVNPPLRSQKDVQALLAALKKGVVDVLATDHAPHTAEEKEVEFDRAPFGINGLETAVSLLLDRLVNKNVLDLSRFIEMISTNPARILGLTNKGRLTVGADADLTILNLHKETVIDITTFASKSRNNPFDGWKLKGAPVMTIVAGRVVYPFS